MQENNVGKNVTSENPTFENVVNEDEKIDNNDKKNTSRHTNKTVEKIEIFFKTIFKAKRILILFAVIIIATFLFINSKTGKEGKISIAISSVLNDANVISELSTLIVPYNSICKVEEEKKKETDPVKFKYYIAYNGTVFFGFDFKNVDIRIDQNNKIVNIKLPQIKIFDTDVDHNSIEIIYVDSKYDKEGSFKDRMKECDADLKNKAENEEHVYELARESAENTIKNLLKPIIDHIDNSYVINFNN